MNTQRRNLFVLPLLVVMLLPGACSSGKRAASTPTPTPATISTPTPPPLQDATATPPGAITSLEGAGQAVIRVKSQGHYFDPPSDNPGRIAGRGSGFIIHPSGIAVTNNHVVAGAEAITVWIGDDPLTEHAATVLGVSECYDLAVIDIEGEGYPYLVWSPDEAAFGQEVRVGGFGLDSRRFDLSRGIVMNTEVDGQTDYTDVERLLEYSARVPVGVSGGPVLASDGKVVGVHLSSVSASQWAEGLTTAAASGVIDELRTKGNLDSLGLSVQAVANGGQSQSGVWVMGVQPGGGAQTAGILAGDIITSLGGQPVGEGGRLTEYCQVLRSTAADQAIQFEAFRPSSGERIQGQVLPGGIAIPATPTPTEIPRVDGALNHQATQPGDIYFSYEFEENLEGMDYFYTSGDPDSVSWQVVDGALRLEFQSIYTYVYFIYQQLSLPDVRLDIRAANLGENNNYVNLICRYSEFGWYEFSVSSNGLYKIYRYDPTLSDPYKKLAEGGSFDINMGHQANDYTAICQGDELTLMVNGVPIRTVTNNELDDGRVGFSVASLDRPPVILEIDQFIVSVP